MNTKRKRQKREATHQETRSDLANDTCSNNARENPVIARGDILRLPRKIGRRLRVGRDFVVTWDCEIDTADGMVMRRPMKVARLESEICE